MQNDLHVVLGASGGAGAAIVAELAKRGHRVRAVNRSGDAAAPEVVERRAADITDPAGAGAAVDGAAVVYMAAQPAYWRWPEEFPSMLETVIDATAAAGAKLVMVDNLYMYGPGITTMKQNSPERGGSKKGRVRARMARALRDADEAGRLRVAIGRASDYFGPGADNSALTALAIEPAAAGKTARWMGKDDVPHSVAYLPDIARAYAILGESDAADGGIWILPHTGAPTGAEFLDALVQALDEPVKTGTVGTLMLRLAAPFHRISRESLDIAYQWTEPFVADDTRFQATFGPFETTPLDEALAETIRSYRARAAVTT